MAETAPATPADEAKAKGNAFYASGDYVKAVNAYNQGIKIDPTNAVLLSNRAAAFLKAGKEIRALKDAEEVIRLRPEWAKGYFRKGACLEKLQRWDEALTTLKQADELEPANKDVQQLLRVVLASHPNGQAESSKLKKERAAKRAAAASAASGAPSPAPAPAPAAAPAPAVPVPVVGQEEYDQAKQDLVHGAAIPFTPQLLDDFVQETEQFLLDTFKPKEEMSAVGFFQPGFLDSEGKDVLGRVGISKAFESPETLAQCTDFLRKYTRSQPSMYKRCDRYGMDMAAHAALILVPKATIGYPCVWQVNKKEWTFSQKVEGVFMQLEAPGTRKIWFIPARREDGMLQPEIKAEFSIDRFALVPPLFR